MTDLQVDLQRNMQMGSRYEQELVQVETQLNVVNSLNEYINNPANLNKTIPTNVGWRIPRWPLLPANITDWCWRGSGSRRA